MQVDAPPSAPPGPLAPPAPPLAEIASGKRRQRPLTQNDDDAQLAPSAASTKVIAPSAQAPARQGSAIVGGSAAGASMSTPPWQTSVAQSPGVCWSGGA